MTCTCKSLHYKCPNKKNKVIGHYCILDLQKSEKVEMRKLRYGDKFSFETTPYAINTVIGILDDRVQYKRHDDWKQSGFNLDRVVNRIL